MKRALLGFTLAFAASLAAIPHLLPRRFVTQPMKLPYFTAHKDDYDIVFLGTSEIYFHVIPSVFDEELRRAGYSCRSFNFGLGGMTGSEGLFYWRTIRDLRPSRLQYLFVDLDLMPIALHRNAFARRVVAAQNSAITWITVRELFAAGYPAKQRWPMLWRFGRTWLDNFLNRGIAGDFLDGEPPFLAGVGEEGYMPALRRLQPPFDFDGPAYLQRIRQPRGQGFPPDAPARFSAAFVERIVAEAKAAGLTPFLVRGPLLDDEPVVHEERRFDFSDLDRYPDLYTLDARFDDTHLNAEGARRLTVHLAQEVAGWLKREGRGCAVH